MASAERLGYFLPFLLPTHIVAMIPLGVTTLAINGSQVGAALFIATFCAINYVGLRVGAGFLNVITVIKIGSLIALA